MRIIDDYRCTNCSTETEFFVKRDEVASLKCPECGFAAMERMIGAPHLDYIGMVTNGESSSDDMTTSIDKWEKMRAQKATIERREAERHGAEQ